MPLHLSPFDPETHFRLYVWL
uniref:Uncharacterized protein n=1 Tax=Anguilla anguilla TaxID=7936 RepID=A0A0E9TN50_ANGAN